MRRLEIKSERWSEPELKPLVSESEGLLERESRREREFLSDGVENFSGRSEPMGSKGRKPSGGFPRTFPRGLLSMLRTDCVLVCAAVSESWVLQGLSHPVRLRDCRPRHRSLVSGRPREDSCVDVGKSILLATASSESWMSARMENKQKLESSGLLFSF